MLLSKEFTGAAAKFCFLTLLSQILHRGDTAFFHAWSQRLQLIWQLQGRPDLRLGLHRFSELGVDIGQPAGIGARSHLRRRAVEWLPCALLTALH